MTDFGLPSTSIGRNLSRMVTAATVRETSAVRKPQFATPTHRPLLGSGLVLLSAAPQAHTLHCSSNVRGSAAQFNGSVSAMPSLPRGKFGAPSGQGTADTLLVRCYVRRHHIPHDMKLTKIQAAWLKNSLRAKDTQPSFWRVFWSARGAWMMAIPLCALGLWWFGDQSPVLGCASIALGWGFLFTSIMLSRRAVNLWPVYHEVTDWQKVETLVRDHDHAA